VGFVFRAGSPVYLSPTDAILIDYTEPLVTIFTPVGLVRHLVHHLS
jgi:hypothetical protein